MTKELIAEAREFLASEYAQYYDSSLVRSLTDALEAAEKEIERIDYHRGHWKDEFEALEAATRAPVQGEPHNAGCYPDPEHPGYWICVGRNAQNHSREVLEYVRTTYARQRFAPNEELRADKMTAEEAIESVLKRPGMYGLVDEEGHRSMKAERDAALAAIAEVRDILNRDDFGDDWEHDEWVYRQAAEKQLADIEAALDGAPEPEWEYAAGYTALDGKPHPFENSGYLRFVAEADREKYGSDEAILVRRRKAGPWLQVEGEKP